MGMPISTFSGDVLHDYEAALDLFFDPETGGVLEPGREDGAPRFLFTEVTGYALLDFLLLHKLTGRPEYLARTARSADWIKDHGQDISGGILTRYYFELDDDPALTKTSFTGRRIYAFDTGICLRGMVASFRALKNPAYLDSAVRMGDFLLDKMMYGDGHVHAIFDGQSDSAVPADPEVWSRSFGAFHTKVAEALIDLFAVTQSNRYKAAAIAICDAALAFMAPDGRIETSRGRIELHPHCYATEGLLHVGRQTGEQKFIDAARRATEWALRQCRDGEIAQSFDFASGTALSRFRTDALSQVLALGSDLRQMNELDTNLEANLDGLAKRILAMKAGTPPFYRYGYYEREIGGKQEADTRSYWTNMFCLRGLFKYYLSSLVKNTSVAILAGGIGSRVWPISCENRPKPVSMSLLGDRSLLQETIRRYRHDYLIPPDRIFILCSRNALELASAQAMEEGLPAGNCIIEPEPKGTIPAVNLACQGLPPSADPQNRLVIVSMADNVIAPYEIFQTALVSALITARENDALVSIGRPVNPGTPRDDRFGHMIHRERIGAYRSYRVDRFAEKPDKRTFDALSQLPGDLAWESGCVVFKEQYFRTVVPTDQDSGNLAEHLLCRAGPWDSPAEETVRVATAVLDDGVAFEDFGVPGSNMLAFYKGHPVYDRGHGNICVGKADRVRMVACSNNLVIADELSIQLYGLSGFVVIDNAVTNTTVIMKLADVHHLPNLYRLFLGSKGYEAFVTGGPNALQATPTTFVERSPNTRSTSEFGLIFAFNFPEHLAIERTRSGVLIKNQNCPRLSSEDFDVLSEKQSQDPKLVEHLVRVGALAKAIAKGDLTLPQLSGEVLRNISLYHAFGGHLTDNGEKAEMAALRNFKNVSSLDLRLLDSQIVREILAQEPTDATSSIEDLLPFLNVNVNSALEFLRKRKLDDRQMRDLVVGLLQVQNSAPLFRAFRQNLQSMGLLDSTPDIERAFACFKLAQHVCNGRWAWKREHRDRNSASHAWFLEHDRGALEEFPFILAFSLRWLLEAGIEPRPYAIRCNELFADQKSDFMGLIIEMQDGRAEPAADVIYRHLLRHGTHKSVELAELVVEQASALMRREQDRHQWLQLLELPAHLETIASLSGAVPENAAEVVQEAILEFYHSNWKQLKALLPKERLAALLTWRTYG